jgi:hypothetical protein
MLSKIFPAHYDNVYRGHKFALVLLVFITIFNTIMWYQSVFNTYYAAAEADNIPLASYPADAALQIISIFAKLGNVHFIFIVLSVLALIRYRSMISLVFLLQIWEYVTRLAINNHLHDTPWVSLPGDLAQAIVQSLFYAMLLGFALSLWHRDRSASPS